ncbi:MAG TPA: glycosyltransferase family 2 protein, partial [Candidatus Baltobacteraceae bacterium]|nr:glycosyltransferase family 2 protein [Candidatus Baltobacteraceae bacterium]
MKTLYGGRIQAFGASAQRFASRLPEGLSVVACDATDCARALAAAVDRRVQGEVFFSSVLLDDARALTAARMAHHILEQVREPSALRMHFDALAAQQLQINDQPIDALPVFDAGVISTMNDVVLASDALLVRSHTELARLRTVLRGLRQWIAVAPGVATDVPAGPCAPNGPVVVWAPDREASQLGVIAYALDYLFVEAIIVCKGGSLSAVRSRFVTVDDFTLDRASVIVDASISDPGTAIGLSALGIPLACASTSGAFEFVAGVNVYDPWNWKSVLAAVSAARAGATPALIGDPMPAPELARVLSLSAPAIDPNGPLVSVIIPTYNRPALLDACLERFERQTYRNFEVIVVNDAGQPVEQVTCKYPRVRLINLEKNGGPHNATNVGIAAARGKYIGMSPDDDYFTLDALARYVAAFEASGALVVNSNGIIRFLKNTGQGEQRTVGHRWLAYLCLDRMHQMWGGAVTIGTMMFHRSIFETDGLLPDSHAGDYDYPLRLSQKYDFVHVDNVTLIFNYAMDRSSFGHGGSLEALIAEYHEIWSRHPSGGSEI